MLTFKNYDVGITSYFKSLYEWSVYASPDRAFQQVALEFEDKVPMPFIAINRTEFALNPIRNTSAFFKGRFLSVTDEKVAKERMFPILLTYQVDVWGDDHEVAAQLFSELLFGVNESPLFKVECDALRDPFYATMILTDVNDNSEPSQIASRGRLYRYSMTYQVQASILKFEERDRIHVIPQLFDYRGNKLD